LLRLRQQIARRLGRKLPLDEALDLLLAEARRQLRWVITHHLMTLHLSGESIHLGRDLPGSFPQSLGQIANAKLKELLTRIDPTPIVSLKGGDWANFSTECTSLPTFPLLS
jgi:hypothetical protein